jgi:hypothetical protein
MSDHHLPAIRKDDGFSPLPPTDEVIVGTRLKFIDGKLTTADGIELPADTKVLAFGTDNILQRWSGQQADTIREKPLPNPDELNAAIPRSEWELDLNGQPRPPWQLAYIVYLLDPRTAEKFTFINSTVGARMAVKQLQDRVASMRMLRGTNVIAEVELASRPMKTKYGQKLRPHFHIISWRQVGGMEKPKLTKMSEPSTGKALDDSIPF